MLHDILLAAVCLVARGFLFSWKIKGGLEVAWIGYGADLTMWEVGLSDSRAAWLSRWLEALETSKAILVQSVIEGLGRLGLGVLAADELKLFLVPSMPGARSGPRSFVETPALLRLLARFLRSRIAAGRLRASVRCDDPVFGEAPGLADFRADARAEGDEVVVRGWLCHGGFLPRRPRGSQSGSQGRTCPGRSHDANHIGT